MRVRACTLILLLPLLLGMREGCKGELEGGIERAGAGGVRGSGGAGGTRGRGWGGDRRGNIWGNIWGNACAHIYYSRRHSFDGARMEISRMCKDNSFGA